MAQATATYEIVPASSAVGIDLYSGSQINVTISRTSSTTPPANAYVISGRETVNEFWCYSGTITQQNIGYSGSAEYYGKTGGYDKSSNQIYQSVGTCYPQDTQLQVGTNGTSGVATVVTNGSGRVLKLSSSTKWIWTVTYDVQATASSATYTNPVTIGATNGLTINISNADISTSTLTHTISLSIGSYSDNISLGLGVTSTTYTIPSSWANAITNSDSGICTMTVSTYSGGSFIGSRSYSVTLNVPSGAKPTIGSLTTARINNSVPSSWGIYVQGKSGVTITANDCQGASGSTITKYVITGGMSATQSTNSFTLNPIQSSGTITFTVTITDSRGQTASQSVSIYVYAYSVPSITEATAYKCNSSGTSTTSGTYLALKMTATYSPVSGNNSMSLRAYYRAMGSSSWIYATTLSNGVQTIIGGSLDPEQNYEVQFIAADALTTVTRVVDINSVAYTLHFKNGGQGMGIGQINTLDNALQINNAWTIYHGSYVVPSIIYSTSQPTGKAGVIWLKPVT